MNDIRETKSEPDGSYQLTGCQPIMARVVVSAKGRAMELKEVRVESDMQPVDFTLKPGGKIRVRVVDKQGNPIPKPAYFFKAGGDASVTLNSITSMIMRMTKAFGNGTRHRSMRSRSISARPMVCSLPTNR